MPECVQNRVVSGVTVVTCRFTERNPMATTTTTTTTASATGGVGLRVHAQRFGTFLSNMVMPNIGAIIAWGLITAFFIPVGWTPIEKIATIVGPGIY